jgi:hypothetical protein
MGFKVHCNRFENSYSQIGLLIFFLLKQFLEYATAIDECYRLRRENLMAHIIEPISTGMKTSRESIHQLSFR